MSSLSFIHRYQAPARSGAPTLLLLHGTGGDENDLLPLVDELWPGAGALSPRGKVLERGMPRFFRRLAEGIFDIDDLKQRTTELADFVTDAAAHYGFDATRVIAAGFSNGANIAGSLLLMRPSVLHGAILFRAMVPFVPETLLPLPGTPVLVSNGRLDPLISPDETERLVSLLRQAGGDVTLEWQATGHNLSTADLAQARAWLSNLKL